MNKRLGTVLLFALLVSAGASAVLYRFITNKLGAPPPAQHLNKVLVAAHSLEIGTLIKPSDVSLAEWPGPVPGAALQNVNDALERGVVSAIYEGEPILEGRLAPKGAGGGLAATIPAGMRAVAVRVNEVVGVSGFVLPGMRVDVVVDGNPPGNSGATGTMSKIILQDIQVLSAGPNFQREKEGKPLSVPVVNLLVTPEQAEVLSLASNETRIQLVLRNPLDKSVAKTHGADMANLFTEGRVLGTTPSARPITLAPSVPKPHATPTPVRAEKPIVIEVIEGAKRSEVRIDGQ